MDDLPLTKKRKEWVRQFKPTAAIRGKILHYNSGVQQEYERALISIVVQMTRQTRREIERYFKGETAKEFFATDESISSGAKTLTDQLLRKFNQMFADKADSLARSMVDKSDAASSSNLHGSLKELSGGLSLKTTVLTKDLKQVLSASITENVGLIKSIASEYLTGVQGAVMRSITTGNGLQDLIPYLQQHEGITIRRAKNIALDQTRKVYSSLNAGRMEALNLDKYEWIHSGGGMHPRALHRKLDGKICSLSKPPVIQYAKGSQPEVRGKPGDLPNCGCTMRPIVSFENGDPD